MRKLLSELKPGERARILKIHANSELKSRFQVMGILPGEVLKVEKVAPLGDPIEVTVKGYYLSLRKNEADNIEVEVIK